MSSEAAERLRNDLAFAAPELWQLHIERRMEERAAAERKATVERIEAASIRSTRVGLPGPAEVWIVPVVILDAEAER